MRGDTRARVLAPAFFFAQPDCSATSSITCRIRAVSSGYFVHLSPLGSGAVPSLRLMMRGSAHQFEQILHAVAPGCRGQFIGEGLHPEGMIDIGDRAQPADAHVRLRRSVFGAQVGDRRTAGPPSPCPSRACRRTRASRRTAMKIGGNTLRCSQAVGWPLSSVAAFMYMAATA